MAGFERTMIMDEGYPRLACSMAFTRAWNGVRDCKL